MTTTENTVTIDLSTLAFTKVGDKFAPFVLIEGGPVYLVKTPSLEGTKGTRTGGDLAWYLNDRDDEADKKSAGQKVRTGLRSGALIPAWTAPKSGLKAPHLEVGHQVIKGKDLATLADSRKMIKECWLEGVAARREAEKEEAKAASAARKEAKAQEKETAAAATPARTGRGKGGKGVSAADRAKLAAFLTANGQLAEALKLID